MNAVYCAGHLAWNLWIEGFPERAITPSLDAKRMAEKSGNPFNEVHYYGFAGFLHQCRGDIRMTLEVAKENLHLSQENGYQLNIVWATMQKGILDVLEEKREEGLRAAVEGLEFWKAVGMRVFVPYWQVLIADAFLLTGAIEKGLQLLEEAETLMQETDHRMWEAEMHRIRGELLLKKTTFQARSRLSYVL